MLAFSLSGSARVFLLATGFGKTFAYECLPILYDYLYNSAWKHNFREDYNQLPQLRSLVPVPWAFFSATQEAFATAELQADLGIRDPVIIRGLFSRPNIFLDVKFFKHDDIQAVTAPLVEQLRQDEERSGKMLIYAVKGLASEVAVLMGDALGQYDGKTGGHKRVDFFIANSSNERKEALRRDFMLAQSKTKCLLATNALGMGLNILALYSVMDLDFVRLLADWCQEFGQAGRDERPSHATLFITSMRGKGKCLKKFVDAARTGLCLRMVIARHFDPTCLAADIRKIQPGGTDAEKAHSCCCVCRARGTMLDPAVVPVCACGATVATPFCGQCGAKRVNLPDT